jgi:MarR family transcriptional regulator, negative regulator of the multidrug operon emrRAB
MTTKCANLLGALALTLSDQLQNVMQSELELAGIPAAALVVINAERGITIEVLAKALKLSQSNMVRAVQLLEAKELIRKSQQKDRRKFSLLATTKGKRKVKAMLGRRATVLESALSKLTVTETSTLESLLAALLKGAVKVPTEKFSMCRLCDEDACGPDCECPVESGAKAAQTLIGALA